MYLRIVILQESKSNGNGEVVIVTFHREILKKIYEKELPFLLQQSKKASNQSSGTMTS
ncbi:hypothetical protein [Sphingobacterium arenae]|uniref:Uncharacterized protein n=1 Tax=Sphingobacterium arenae TaxID=1280598 RepID=A0ABR7Y464_9SPHI|nr:hypothetical protein [Sphingobacterium arenae]MBD1426109.1 hypothetical protein [Sphingobacterium arenae]